MKTKITLKTAIKAKNFNKKKLKYFVGKKRNETNVFQLCCGQRAYVGYVGWKNLESYVEMVAGLPRKRTKNEYFVNQTKDRSNERSNKK